MRSVTGIIDHRILLNYRIDPEALARVLPPPFRPMTVNGCGIGGICQVSLSKMRLPGMPAFLGSHSHNAAHRIAVESDKGPGVYIVRRDTNAILNSISGGRLFPGVYRRADFSVNTPESDDQPDARYEVAITDPATNETIMRFAGTVVAELPTGSIFENAGAVSDFFKRGNVGWSPGRDESSFDAIELVTHDWNMAPMQIHDHFSAYFLDPDRFPSGAVEFDSAMIMRGLPHAWVHQEHLCTVCT